MRRSLLLLALWTQSALAQQPVSGTVRTEAGGPIAAARVTLGRLSATTDSLGAFRFDSVKAGTYPLTVRAARFYPYREQVVHRARPFELSITLEREMARLPDIVVEGRRTGIYGTVGDATTGGRIGARVEVVGHGGGVATTDTAGRFAFPGADRGDYLIVVSLDGFQQRRLSLRIDDGRAREFAIGLTSGLGESPGRLESWALEDLRQRLAAWPARTRMTRADFDRFDGVQSLCDVARVQYEAGTGATVVLNGVLTLVNWPLCDIMVDEIELIEFSSQAPTGRRRGALPPRRGVIYVWERR